jgi:hypothetical protein
MVLLSSLYLQKLVNIILKNMNPLFHLHVSFSKFNNNVPKIF